MNFDYCGTGNNWPTFGQTDDLGIKTSGRMVTRQDVDLISHPAYQQNCSYTKNLTTRIFSGLFGPSFFWRCNQNSDLWVSSITTRKCIYFVSNKEKIVNIFDICFFSGNDDAFENLLFRHVEKFWQTWGWENSCLGELEVTPLTSGIAHISYLGLHSQHWALKLPSWTNIFKEMTNVLFEASKYF